MIFFFITLVTKMLDVHDFILNNRTYKLQSIEVMIQLIGISLRFWIRRNKCFLDIIAFLRISRITSLY
jgi:hypothetical protein